MRCEFRDGLKVDYSGSLRLSKGDDIDTVVGTGDIPADLKGYLDAAVRRNSCGELRTVAQEVSNAVGIYLNTDEI